MVEVVHDQQACTFTLHLPTDPKGQNSQAVILYRRLGRRSLDLYHTEVPSWARGRGFGRRLAVAAVATLRRQRPRRRIILSCTFLAALRAKGAL